MDALVAVAVIASLYLAFRRIGWWKWFWLANAALVGVFELTARLVTGKTLSQQYWAWAQTSPWWWLPASLIAVGGIGLALHLVWRKVRR